MNASVQSTIVAVAVAGLALVGSGCSDRKSNPDMAVTQPPARIAQDQSTATAPAATRAGVAIDDATITTKVKAAVLAEPGLKSLQISVDTKDAVVTLAGNVDTPALKERATQIAQGVEGVRSVIDNLVVKAS